MSDPYKTPRSIDPTTSAPGVTPRVPGDDYSRTNVRIDSAPPIAVRSGSGFGTGLMVALVFVVVAVIAYALVGNRDDAGPVPPATSDVTIENNAAPADPAAETPSTDALAPDTAAPDATAPDAAAPDAAPDTIAPEATEPAAPEAPAPDAAPAAPANP
jgi:hypothetical protein